MRLLNLTRKQTITSQLMIAKTWLEATIGLLNKPKGTAMLFKTRWGIHTFGMKYSIDVLILDKEMKIVKVKRNLPPNYFFFWNPLYSTVIELPSQKKLPVSLGDSLRQVS